MTEAEFAELLEIVVKRTGHERFRVTTDPNHPEYRPGTREAVAMIARGEQRGKPAPPSRFPLEGTVPLDNVVVPIRTHHVERKWEGDLPRKPWEYRVTAAIPHIDTPDLLGAVVETLRAQTERPYILVLDAGSLAKHRAVLERMELESDDLEVHYLRPRAWRFTSEPVAVAMDLAFARCQTEYLYATHTDVFLKRPDYVEWLVKRCDAQTPAVGYQMSPRPASGNDLWSRILSHTGSLYHMPTMRRLGARWNMLTAFEWLGIPVGQPFHTGFPDTETMLGLCLHEAGIGERWLGDPEPGPDDPPSVLMIGTEPNEPYETDWLVHERSTTGHNLYNAKVAESRVDRLAAAVARSRDRVAEWRAAQSAPMSGTLPLDQSLAFHAEVKARRCRTKDTECGCGRFRCAEGKGSRGLVNNWDCLKCLGYIDQAGIPTPRPLAPGVGPTHLA